MRPGVVTILLLAVVAGSLSSLTAVGARRRSRRWSLALLAGLFFPVAWIVWYVRDERPYRKATRSEPSRLFAPGSAVERYQRAHAQCGWVARA